MALKLVQERASFLDLPPELRNKIYRDVLVQSRRIRVGGRIPLVLYRDFPERQAGCSLHVNVLRSCRHIHAEAAPLLYGANTFYVACGNCTNFRYILERFPWNIQFDICPQRVILTALGRMKRFIRNVQLDHCHQRGSLATYQELRQLPQLRHLTLDVSWANNFRKSTAMARALLPLIRTLHKRSKKSDGKGTKVATVLSFKDIRDQVEFRKEGRPEIRLIEEAISIIHDTLGLKEDEKVLVNTVDFDQEIGYAWYNPV